MGNLPRGTPMYPPFICNFTDLFLGYSRPAVSMCGMASMSIGTPCKEKGIFLKILGRSLLKTLSEQVVV